jgi:hypothetical protein
MSSKLLLVAFSICSSRAVLAPEDHHPIILARLGQVATSTGCWGADGAGRCRSRLWLVAVRQSRALSGRDRQTDVGAGESTLCLCGSKATSPYFLCAARAVRLCLPQAELKESMLLAK